MQDLGLFRVRLEVYSSLRNGSKDEETIKTLLEHGMEGAIVSLSHRDPQATRDLAALYRHCRDELGLHFPLILETRGPSLKTLEIQLPLKLNEGEEIVLSNDLSLEQTNERLLIAYDDIQSLTQVDSIIYLNRGQITAVVKEIKESEILLKLLSGSTLQGEVSVNIPGAELQKPILSNADQFDLQREGGEGIASEAVLLSGVRKGEDLDLVRPDLQGRFAIAKIENQLALQNYEDILEKADAVVVDRQMLNLELPPEKAFIAQKWMVEKANILGKPVLLMNQILESMHHTPRPSRVEASGLRNLVQDGADGVIMGSEVETGEYPVNALIFAAKVAVESEIPQKPKQYFKELRQINQETLSVQETAAQNAIHTINEQDLQVLIIQTQTGNIARLCAKYKPGIQVYAVSEDEKVLAGLAFSRGVYTVRHGNTKDPANLQSLLEIIKERSNLEVGERLLLLQLDHEGQWEEEITIKVMPLE